MKEKILQIAEHVLRTHKRGEEFFSEIDRILAFELNAELFVELRKMIPQGYGIVLSGKFGKQFAQSVNEHKIEFCPYLLVDGGIRSGGPVKLVGAYGPLQKKYVFIDDSIFSGTTYSVIKNWMKTYYDAHVEKCVVAYDGWPEKRNDVESIFRWYDEVNAISV